MKLDPIPKELNLPWRVIPGKSVESPRIVDSANNPVCSFGNQARHRGSIWAWTAATLIVIQVNNATREEPKP